MRVAFYAPLKAPTHPVPSGDRHIARLLVSALGRGGHRVELASTLRSWDGAGDAARQARLRDVGLRLARRSVRRLRRGTEPVGCWFTYHVYHKAPDLIGPAAARALGVPYVVAEASYAARQADGPWRSGLAATREALASARAVVALKQVDVDGVRPHLSPTAELVELAPFIDTSRIVGPDGRAAARAELAADHGLDPASTWLVAVAMMRRGDKASSYRTLGAALARLGDRPYQLLVVGAGEAEAEVRASLEPLGAGRVRFAGLWPQARIGRLLCGFDALVWPAVGEAIGLVFIEAAAAGLPVVAGRSGGVAEVVREGESGLVVDPGDAGAFSGAVARLLDAPGEREALGAAARRRALDLHDLDRAAGVLDGLLARIAPGGRG